MKKNIQTQLILERGYIDSGENKTLRMYHFEETLANLDLKHIAVSEYDPKVDLDKFLVYSQYFNCRTTAMDYMTAYMKYDSGEELTNQEQLDIQNGFTYEQLMLLSITY